MRIRDRDTLYCGVRKEKIQTAHPSINVKNLEYFKDFVIDRYQVHKRKDVKCLPAPWTENPVIQEFKFTNVRREHDKQTRYLLDSVIDNDSLTLEDKIVNCFMFRCWNNYDTFHDFGFPWSAQRIYNPKLKEKVRPKYKRLLEEDPKRLWWSNAYNQGGTKQSWRSQKAGSLKEIEADIPLRPFHVGVWLGRADIVEKLLNAKDQKECFEIIKSVRGFADFLAYQVFVDLTYIEEFPFSENEFTVAGPGCKRGLDYIFEDKDGMTYEECIFWLKNQINGEYDLFNTIGGRPYHPKHLFDDLYPEDQCMNVMSIENCMCELSKYIKAVTGTGRPRNKYKYTGGLT